MPYLPEKIEVFRCPRLGKLLSDVSTDKRGRVKAMKTTWSAELCVPDFNDTLQAGVCIYAIARIGNTLLITPGDYLEVHSLKDKFAEALDLLLSQAIDKPITGSTLKNTWKNASHNVSNTFQRKQHSVKPQRQIPNLRLEQSPSRGSLSHIPNLLCQRPVSQELQESSISHPISCKNHRVAVFVDGSNLFYAASAMNAHIDYRSFLQCIVAKRFLVGAFFYTGFNAAKHRERSFLKMLKCEGYQVIQKKLVSRSDGSKKANLDVELALDMVAYANSGQCDSIVLVSGDGDFTYAVERVRSAGVDIDVIGLRSMTSQSLIRVANRYVNLAKLQPLICLNRPSHHRTTIIGQKTQKQSYHQAA